MVTGLVTIMIGANGAQVNMAGPIRVTEMIDMGEVMRMQPQGMM